MTRIRDAATIAAVSWALVFLVGGVLLMFTGQHTLAQEDSISVTCLTTCLCTSSRPCPTACGGPPTICKNCSGCGSSLLGCFCY